VKNLQLALFLASVLVPGLTLRTAEVPKLLTKERKDSEPAKPISHTERHFEGWTVRVDDRLLKEPNDEFGQRALRFLENKLADIKAVVPADAVLEMPAYELASGDRVVYTRTLNVGPSTRDLLLQVAPAGVGVAVIGQGATQDQKDGFNRLRIPAQATPLAVKLLFMEGEAKEYREFIASSPPAVALEPFTKGGPPRWPEVLNTQVIVGADTQAFAIDVLTHPVNNPWHCQLRLTGFDFFADGRRPAVCLWDGDVWLVGVGGMDAPAKGLTWQRIAFGLFQPLGLKIVKDKIHVCCRDQIVLLHDLNDDGETDFYECFNNDHQVTEHFHEFAMGLQTDADGNFYYAKAARHALKAVVPQHGTLLKVSKAGSKTEILATGFRAPNGVCINPDGTFFLTDQEGFWVPKNRIDLVERGSYYGNFWGYHNVTDPSDAAMKQPLSGSPTPSTACLRNCFGSPAILGGR
jgi:hypothetical protein